ncbi:hypothetical protein ACHAQA_003328 [Verticillium albo-atrum]
MANKADLVDALQGIHTVLSFINQPPAASLEDYAQKNLIDACVAAGVKRFAPSDVAKDDLPFWGGKSVIQAYLEHINQNEKSINADQQVLEYTLFQPGLFLEYLASPLKTAKYVNPLDTFIDFQNRRAILVEGYEHAILTVTSVSDIAGVVTKAVDLEGEWPALGGIRGNRLTVSEIIALGEKIRGQPFAIEKVTLEDLEAGHLNTSWSLGRRHASFTDPRADELAAVLKTVLVGTLLSCAKGAWDVSDAFNRLLPDYEFTRAEDFLSAAWQGRP